MNASDDSNLGHSWVVNTDNDGHISWDEGDDSSEEEQALASRPSPSVKHRRVSRGTPTHSQSGPKATTPEFMMPSLESLTPHKPLGNDSYRRKTSATQGVPNRTRSSGSNQSPVYTHLQNHRKTQDNITSVLIGVGQYILDIATSTLKKLQQPISWALAAYLFAGMLVLVQNLLTNSLSHALSPICRVPGVSMLGLPICSFTSRYANDHSDDDIPTIDSSSDTRSKSKRKQKVKGKSPSNANPSPEFDTLMQVQSQFSTLIDDSSSSVALSLPLDMKRSETSIRDLKQVVRFSALRSKNELVLEFDGFIDTARIASYDLQKFNSHVGRAVDNVLSTTRWTGRALDEIAVSKSSRGLIPSFIQDRLLAPFQPLMFNEGKVLEHYILHSRIVSDEISRLVDEATGLLTTLGNLEDRLDVIHGIALRDGIAAKADRDEVLSQLWTILGGNRSKLGKVDNQLKLLSRVAEYRKMAYEHVSSTVVKLQAMGAELEELRSRVAAVEVLRDSGKTVPLHVHLDAIKLGVERLESQREKAREIERGHARRVIALSQSGHEAVNVGAGGENEAPLLVGA